ncbi:uncharacterized protein A4U43_C04F3740 [Asparagus officinalis]|uniref:RRM domain-containing protein n=1 Tax=Asparagus officinalis TaxID=4686 RepID=A0A5P1EY30_ASPOF|nr:uncharacterized protein LOC109836545 [Asparagus officinalis]XP_020260056.1 uncharacterized protein LOC109836545 [Asparagus officinalis]ONK71005.1 uncharacterized protein A4U43_C04F3740 [Asparagus officinalis]
MSTSNELAKKENAQSEEKLKQARKEYAEFEEKVKRTVFLSNLSPQVTSAVIETALGQFGNVLNVEFLPNYTIPYPIPPCALVEMENPKQAKAVVADITNYPFMMSGMPRPITAQAATNEMFADRPSNPDRKIRVRWVEPSDPEFEVGKKLKELAKKHNAETLALIKATLDEEEKLAKQQEETLKAHYNKFEMIESVMQDSSAPRLARKYGFNLAMDDEWHDRD